MLEYNIGMDNLPPTKLFNTLTNRKVNVKTALRKIKKGQLPNTFINNNLLWNTKDKVFVENKRLQRRFERKERKEKKIQYIEKQNKRLEGLNKLYNLFKTPQQKQIKSLDIFKQRFNLAPVKIITNTTQPNDFGIRSEKLNYTKGGTDEIITDIVNRANSQTKSTARIYIVDNNTGKYFTTAVSEQAVRNALYETIERVMVSDEEFEIMNADIFIRYYDIPSGSGMVKIPKWIEQKSKSVCLIKNDDDLCGQMCCILGMCNDETRKYYLTKKGNKDFMDNVIKLCDMIDTHSSMNLLDFSKVVEKYDANYRFVIFSDLDTIIEETDNTESDPVYIYYDSKIEHYHLITNINGFMNDKKGHYKFCCKCKKRFRKEHYDHHKCSGLRCNLCFTQFNNIMELEDHKLEPKSQPCPNCNIMCRGEECLMRHILGDGDRKGCKGKNYFFPCCLKAGYNMSQCWGRPEDIAHHKCDHAYCKTCDDYLPREHRCYLKPLEEKDTYIDKLIAFDFESRFDSNNKHYVNFIVAKERLTNIRKIWRHGDSEDILQDFIDWCFTKKKTTFVAHNGKAYDTWLIHRKICSTAGRRPTKLILAGQKIMYMSLDGISFIDSINHFSMALEKVPSTFGLDEDQFKKGFYPYLFNTDENWDYVGKIPHIKHYNPNAMKPKKRKEFVKWYKEMERINYVYNHKKETEEYCISDVDILLEGCNKYSHIGHEITGIDPLSKTTIASWVMKVYRTKFYDFNKTPIAILKKDEYDFIKKSFHGGRTETIRTYRKWSDEELNEGKGGRYFDITSLYPTVQFYDEMPYGEPKWVENVDLDYITNNYGFYEVDITMNKNLFISPLVSHRDGKLTADNVNKERVVIHSKEILNAVKVGCVVDNVYKGLVFKSTESMFKDFVKTFMRIKVEASGEPNFYNLKDPTKKNLWLDTMEEKYGFRPNPEKTENSGLRSIAKMILNSLWGKFGQRPDMPTDKYICPSKIKEWYKILRLAKLGHIELKTDELSGEHLFVSYVDKRESTNSTLKSTSIAVASSTTANARIRLFRELHKLGERVLYHDTDSIVFEYDPNGYNIELGEYLGDWTCETGGKLICEWVSTGAKSYSYKVDYLVKDVKIKGITLNYSNHNVITFDNMKKLVDGKKDKLITKENIRFVKDGDTLRTTKMLKDMALTMDKRINADNYYTYPKDYEGELYHK